MLRNRVVARRAATTAVLTAIALATLYPSSNVYSDRFNLCLLCGSFATLDLLHNVALFVPLGAVLAWPSDRHQVATRVALWCLLVSLTIEILQIAVVPGRDASVADVFGNVSGGILGAFAVVIGSQVRSARHWLLVSWGCALASAGVLAVGAWAVRIDAPYDRYFVQWRPRRPNYSPFLGELSTVSLGSIPLKSGQILESRRLPAAFFDGQIQLSATLTSGVRPDGLALIVRLVRASGEFLMVGRQHDALAAQFRSNARRVGLRSAIYAADAALRGDPAAERRVQVAVDGAAVELSVLSAPFQRTQRQRLTAARFWASLLPFDRAFGRSGFVGDLTWLALLFAPAAYAGGRAIAGWRGKLPALALAAFLGAIALRYQPALGWWPYWATVACAMLLSLSLGIAARRRVTLGATLRPHSDKGTAG